MKIMTLKKVAIVSICCLPAQLLAAEWVIDADVRPTLKYDDNELMQQNERGDFSLTMTPTLSMSRNLENSKTSLSLGYQINRYDRLKQLDRQDPFVNIASSINKERSSLGLSMGYSERESRSFADEDAGDFTNTSTVRTRNISPSFSYRLTELDTLSANYSYSDTSNSNGTNNDTNSLSLRWARAFSERLSGGMTSSFSNTESRSISSSSDNKVYGLSLNSIYYLSEVWSIDGSVGMRYLDSEFVPVVGRDLKKTSNGETYNVSVNRERELSSLTLSAAMSISPVSTGGVNEQNVYTTSYRRMLSEKLIFDLTASYREFRTPESNNKTTYIDFSPSVKWMFSEKASLNLSYKFRQNEDNSSDKTKSNAVFASFQYDWDGIRLAR